MTKEELILSFLDNTASKDNYQDLGILKFGKACFEKQFSNDYSSNHYDMAMLLFRLLDPDRVERTQKQAFLAIHREAAKTTIGTSLFPKYLIYLKGHTMFVRRAQLMREDDYELVYDENNILISSKWNNNEADPNEIISIEIDEAFIVIVSITASLAENFVSDIKRTIDIRGDLVELFGEKKPSYVQFDDEARVSDKKWTKSAFVTADDTVVYGLGAGQAIRGRKVGDSRPTLIIADDIYSEETIKTEERRMQTDRWFFNAMVNSLDAEKGKILLLGTILHPDTVFKTIVKDVFWFGIIRPIISIDELKKLVKFVANKGGLEKDNRYLLSNQAKYDLRDFQKTLKSLSWPEKLTAKYIISLYKQQMERGTLNNFYQEFMNMSHDPDSNRISEESFLRMPFKIFNNYGVQYIEFTYGGRLWTGPVTLRIGLDIAASESARSDDTVISVVGFCRVWPKVAGIDWRSSESSMPMGKVFPVIAHMEGGKYSIQRYGQMMGMCEAIEGLCKRYKIERIVAEANGQQLQVVRAIQKYMREQGIRARVDGKFNSIKKSERIMAVIEPLAHKYKHFICIEDKTIDKMIMQLMILGTGDHDDYIDSPSIGFEEMEPPGVHLKIDRNTRTRQTETRQEKAIRLLGRDAWKIL